MGVADHAGQMIGAQLLEIGQDIVRVRIDVLGEQVLIDRTPGRGMDQRAFRILSQRQSSQNLPTFISYGFLGLVLEDLPRPVAGPLRTDVQVVRLVEDGVIVIAAQHDRATLDYNVQTFLGAGPSADYVAQAIDLLDVARFNVSHTASRASRLPWISGNCEHFLLHPPAVSPVWRAGRSRGPTGSFHRGSSRRSCGAPTGKRTRDVKAWRLRRQRWLAGPRKHSDLRQRGDDFGVLASRRRDDLQD